MSVTAHQIFNDGVSTGRPSPFLRLPSAYSFRNFGRFLKNLSILPSSADKFKKSIQNFAPRTASVKAALYEMAKRLPKSASLLEMSGLRERGERGGRAVRAAMVVVGFRAGDFINRDKKIKSPSAKQIFWVVPKNIAVPPLPERQVAPLAHLAKAMVQTVAELT